MSHIFDMKLIKFIFVGVLNTLFSAAVMFLLYNFLHLGYWGSSAAAYVLGSVLSFFLNKNFTFQNKGSIAKTAVRFSINVAVCYAIAYSLAKPAMAAALSGLRLERGLVEQASMVAGMVLFTAFNYVGQRFFAFK